LACLQPDSDGVFKVKLGHQINLSILILLGSLGLILVAVSYFTINRIILHNQQTVFTRELENIDFNIRQGYYGLEDAGLLGQDYSIEVEKRRLLKILDGYSFGETGHLHIYESNGRVIKGDSAEGGEEYEARLFQQMQNSASMQLDYEENGVEFFAVGSHSSHWDWLMIATISKQELFAVRDSYLKLALGLSALGFFFAAIFSMIISRKLQNRIDPTLDCLRAVERGDLDSRIANSSTDEIGQIQTGINSMLETVALKTHELEASNNSLLNEVAERKNTEQALQLAKDNTEAVNHELKMGQQRLQLVVDTAPVVIVLKDRQGRYLLVNTGFEQTTGISREYALGKTAYEIFSTENARVADENELQLMDSGQDYYAEEEVLLPDGNMRTFYSRKVLLRDVEDGVTGLVQASLDVSEQKLSEQALVLAKESAEAANQAKSIFLGNMSHELRTPLNAILGFSQMLAQDPDASRAQQEKFSIINRSGTYLLGMINDVLDLSRIEAGRIELEAEIFDLPTMLKNVARKFEVRALSTGLIFNVEIDPGIAPVVKADIGKLRQIISNLLDNAIKFTTEGSFTLRARTLPVYADPDTVTLSVSVEDTGIGIEEAQQARIFEPFAQASRVPVMSRGTGLGLPINRSFIELMGGDISVKSKLGEGSIFHFEVPVALSRTRIESQDPIAANPAIVGQLPDQPNWRILVVEDYFDSRLLLKNLLNQAGFETREAENGKEAVRIFKVWQPHLIWMDLRMPLMDGYEATREIRQLPEGDKVKIVALTASAFKDQRASILKAGCDDIVHKPFQALEVFDTMAAQLGVRYLYDEAVEAQGGEPIVQDKLDIADIPDDLLLALKSAAQSLSNEEFGVALAQVANQESALVRRLLALAHEFRFDLILKILEDGQ